MIGEGTLIMVEAKTSASAATDGSASTFEAHPLLLSESGSPSIGKNPETFDVCNTSTKRVCAGDRMPVAKTIQGHFVTASLLVGRAMSAVFEKDGEEWNVTKYWEGEDPEICGPPIVECLFGCDCLKDGDKVYARYSPEDDKYYAVSSASAMLGPARDIEVMVDTDGVDLNNLVGWSTINCGDFKYATRTIKAFDCEPPASPNTPDTPSLNNKIVAWNGTIQPVLVGATITTNGTGQPCLTFATANALVCATVGTGPAPVLLCGTECCEETIHYKRFQSPNDVPAGATDVGEYDFEVDGSPLTDTVAEQCFADGDATEGWVQGSAEALGEDFTRENPSPECCPDEEPAP